MATKPKLKNHKGLADKKTLLKSILKGKVAPDGASPVSKLDGGLGSVPLTPGSGNGSNLGTNGIF